MQNIDQPRRIRLLSILFFSFVFPIYLLSYQGIPVSDDEQLFASAAQTLIVKGKLDAPQLYGNERLQGKYQGSGLLHPILASPVIRLARLASLGQLQAVYLLPPFYTALTAALLFYHILKSGYRLRTGLIAGILFSLGTIAWPYSQTFYREPLAMLLLTLSWLSFMTALEKNNSRRKRIFASAGFGVAYVGVLLTKVLLIVVLPAFLVILWRAWFIDTPERDPNRWRKVAYVVLAVVVGVAALWVMNSLKLLTITPRLTLRFFERLWRFRGEYRYDQVPGALLGMLFSPIKGLFVYSPGVLLAFVPIAKSTLQEKRRTLFAILALLGLLVSQATAYGAEWWNTTWGTRFLLPIIPFFILAGLPVIDAALHSEKRWHRTILWGLVTVSIVIQLSGVLISMATYAVDLYLKKGIPDIGLTIWQPQHAPLIEHWRLLVSGQGPDLAVWKVFPYAPTLISLLIVLCLAIAAASLLLIRRFSHSQINIRRERLVILLPLIAILVIPFVMLTAYQHDPQYAAWRFDIQVAESHLAENAREGDVILVYPYLRGNWYYFINFYGGETPWNSLPPTFPSGDEESTVDLIRSLNKTYDRVWLFSETGEYEPMNTFALQALSQYGLILDDLAWQHADYPRQVRLSLFELWK